MRVRIGSARHQKKLRVMKKAKGFLLGRSKLYRTAKEAVSASMEYAFWGRRERKRQYRQLWITRISAALTGRDVNYSAFINGLKRAKVGLDRKQLSELAIHDPKAFDELVATAKKSLA